MKKINNKGFAISTLIYGVLILFILIISVLISTLNFRYKSLSDITTRAEERKNEYFLNVGIKLERDEEFITPHNGTYILTYIINGVEESCSVFIAKEKEIKHDGNQLIVDGLKLSNCNFGNVTSIDIEKIKATDKFINDRAEVNIPDLRNGLVPVKYINEKSNWVTTTASDPNWYNYSEQKWANAVILDLSKTENINKYLDENGNYKKGVELKLPTATSTDSDVLAMYVWIPRFSYTIGCIDTSVSESCVGYRIIGGSKLNYSNLSKIIPGAIDIKFVDVKTKDTLDFSKGEVPRYQYVMDSDGLPTNDRKPLKWYTHPAFTSNNKNLSGIWVGKFETSVNPQSICYDNLKNNNSTDVINNCLSTKDDVTPRILPNLIALRYQTAYDQYLTARKMYDSELSGDVYMTKNSEWAAVAYLTQSKFGKYGNTSYMGVNKELYINNHKGYATGASAGVAGADQSDSVVCRYNEIGENRAKGTGECGGGASTTGNVYGVYDMSGCGNERVMGIYKEQLTTCNFSSIPSEHYDKFENSKPYDSMTKETIGHGLFEMKGWYEDSNNFDFDASEKFQFSRGGLYSNHVNCGIGHTFISNCDTSQYRSFRNSISY